MTQKPNSATLRCKDCRKIIFGPSTMHNTRCPLCDTGRLELKAKITTRMLYEHERGRVMSG